MDGRWLALGVLGLAAVAGRARGSSVRTGLREPTREFVPGDRVVFRFGREVWRAGVIDEEGWSPDVGKSVV